MSLPKVNKKIFDDVFRRCHVIANVTLRKSKSKTSNYDPLRDTGYAETYQNSVPVKMLTKTVSGSSLTYQGLGLAETGALAVILHDSDVDLIKNADSISINGTSYYAYSEAVGNKFLIYPTDYAKYSKIILFKRDV